MERQEDAMKLINARALAAILSLAACVPSFAADDPTELKDLTSVVALLGVPCGKVVSATRIKDNDHIVTCENGSRYHVYVNAAGRVVAEKQ
jgi:hypothetical protein